MEISPAVLVLTKLLVDFGLVILIWLVQLIVYPSFSYYTPSGLVNWHNKYTPLIGYIVGPLMLTQLGLSIYQVIMVPEIYNILNLSLILAIWLLTALQLVPIHNSISKGRADADLLKSLVAKNWSRTVLWTLIFVLSCYSFFK